MINLHLTPYYDIKEQNRELRIQQAKFVCDNVINGSGKRKWGLAIVGMDMNDVPGLYMQGLYISED